MPLRITGIKEIQNNQKRGCELNLCGAETQSSLILASHGVLGHHQLCVQSREVRTGEWYLTLNPRSGGEATAGSGGGCDAASRQRPPGAQRAGPPALKQPAPTAVPTPRHFGPAAGTLAPPAPRSRSARYLSGQRPPGPRRPHDPQGPPPTLGSDAPVAELRWRRLRRPWRARTPESQRLWLQKSSRGRLRPAPGPRPRLS